MFHIGSGTTQIPTIIAFWAVVTFGLAVIGPFDTYQTLPFVSRLGYWAIIVLLSVGLDAYVRLQFPVVGLIEQVIRRFLYVVVLSVCLFLINAAIFDGWDGLHSFSLAFSYVLVVAIVVEVVIAAVLAQIEVMRKHAVDAIEAELDIPETVPALETLLAKLPNKKRGAIWHLEARGHYLGVMTEHGDAEILMRFSDAIAGLPESLGIQTHRSHWVAHKAAQAFVEEKGKEFLQIGNGKLIPISKMRLSAVKSALMHL